MAAPQLELHHAAPRCLLKLHDVVVNGAAEDGERAEALLEFERWRIPITIARADLEKLIERSAVVLDQNTHRLIHESDWRRWGRRGGLRTLQLYGTSWFALLALRRWDRVTPADLEAARPLR